MDGEPKKKGGKGLLAITGLLAVVAIGLGVGLVIAMSKKCDEAECAKATNEKKAAATATLNYENDEKIRGIIVSLEDAFTSATGGWGADRSFDRGVQISIGDGIIMSTNHSYGIERYDADLSSKKTSLRNKTIEVLTDNGLKKVDEPKGFFSWAESSSEYGFYEGSNIICYYSVVGGNYSVNCADKRWYKEEDKKLTLELAAAYEKKEGNKVGYLGAETKSITKNSAGTYETIVASLDDAAALFYRKVGGEWKFFVGVQQGPGCEAYNTSELKAAYAGEKCWDDSGNESIVK